MMSNCRRGLGLLPSTHGSWDFSPAPHWDFSPVGFASRISRYILPVLWTEQAEGSFSKRYLKYLAKKFLKKMQMRDFLRVVSTNKGTYELKYFNIQENEDDAGDE
mmetsp:Transcript_27786/g.40867  ORF Transcript_27786/g.40867 Transcript_27786/m.40867 type:complete len:105 (-) Transcript_27786:106-420(-)